MRRARGRPVIWTPEMIEAVSDLIRRFGCKWAAAMCGVSKGGLVSSLRYHGVSIADIRRGGA